ncbi:MAG: phosphoadenosine phosphosulfate reductase family protein [Oscillospiraceae bacterium]|nr:phosphoadenosine phosphosulfate reductase family protein [Oscillospiraceae bacterium]
MLPFLHVCSFSGGKDSTAMLLKMLEMKMPVDVVLFCDTGLEFPQLYDDVHMELVIPNVQMLLL